MNSKYNILLVEDDVDDAEMIMYTLRKLDNVSIVHIDDGVEALQYLFEGKAPQPSLILLDIRMPKVDGIQILRRLKADFQLRSIPVAMMISSHEGKSYVQSFGLNPDAYVSKPVDCKSVLEVMAGAGLKKVGFIPGHESRKFKIWPNIGDW
jgi:two-component system response regulator